MSKRMICVLLSFVLVLLSGCAKKDSALLSLEETDVTTLLLRKDGSMQAVFVEEFKKEDYNKEEVRAFIDKGVAIHNAQAGEGAVSVESVEEDGDRLKADFHYKSFGDFMGYGGVNMQAGGLYTMSEAMSQKLLPDTMTAAGDGVETGKEQIGKEEKAKVLTLDTGKEMINIAVEGTILYFSGGVLLSKDTVQLTGEEPGIVVYK